MTTSTHHNHRAQAKADALKAAMALAAEIDAPRFQNGDRLLTVPEVAALTRRSVQAVRWLLHNGTGPESSLVGGRRLMWESDVLEWVAGQSVASESDEDAA